MLHKILALFIPRAINNFKTLQQLKTGINKGIFQGNANVGSQISPEKVIHHALRRIQNAVVL